MFRIEGKHSQAPWLAPSDIVLSRNVKIQLFRPFWTNIWAFNVLGADFFVSLHWKPKPHFWSLPLVMFSLCPIMINFCLRVIEVQSLNSFLWQISTFKKEKREDSSLKYVVHVTCFEVFEIIWKLDYLMFLKIFRRKIKKFDILRNLVWTRLYWVRAGRVRWKLWAVRQNFLRKKPVRRKTGYYFFCLITTTTYFANFKKPSAPEVANHCNEHAAEDCRKMSGRKWLCLRQHQISFWLINLKMVNNCQSTLSIYCEVLNVAYFASFKKAGLKNLISRIVELWNSIILVVNCIKTRNVL